MRPRSVGVTSFRVKRPSTQRSPTTPIGLIHLLVVLHLYFGHQCSYLPGGPASSSQRTPVYPERRPRTEVGKLQLSADAALIFLSRYFQLIYLTLVRDIQVHVRKPERKWDSLISMSFLETQYQSVPAREVGSSLTYSGTMRGASCFSWDDI